ncbi:MAG: hypothetical protein ACE5HX_19645, partial [bacterium]
CCAGVFAYLNTHDVTAKKKWRGYLDEMIDKEIKNANELLELWQTSDVEFMVISDRGETSFIYGENFGELLQIKIELMKKYRLIEPRIDEEIMWKI